MIMSAQNRARVRFRFVSWLLVIAAYVATPSVRADTSFCCPSDISGNGGVDGVDLSLVLTTWGSDGQQGLLDCDINDDGIVSGPDLAILLSGWGPCPLPCLKTVVSGRARFQDGSPATGAVVTTSFGPTTVTNSNGDFSMLIEAPSAKETLTVSIESDWNGLLHSAQRTELVLTFEGVTALGTVALTPTSTCAASDWIAVGVRSAESNGAVYTLCSFDDGGGAKLYAGGSFTILNGVPVNHIARWNGATWESVGAGFSWYVNALAVFDDGTGPALYAGGSFSGGIARWNGKSWDTISGIGLDQGSWGIPTVETLAVFDDGTGPSLYVGGGFTRAGGLSVQGIARWNGNTWSVLPSFPFSASIRSLAVLDAGAGKHLYACVDSQWPGVANYRVARLDGAAWDISFGAMDAPVWALTVFDFGNGPRLVAGGDFTTGGGNWNRGVAVWTGSSWEQVGGGLTAGRARSLVAYRDASGTSLLVGGYFRLNNRSEYRFAARWDAGGWRELGVGPNSDVFTMTVHNVDDTGPSVVVGGAFTQVGGAPMAGVVRWGCEP
jgi:hypothetical protein